MTQRTFTAWLASQGRGSEDVYLLSADDRDAIYHGSYWVKVAGDRMPAGVDLALFDYGVNSGPARALNEAAPVWWSVCGLDDYGSVLTVCLVAS